VRARRLDAIGTRREHRVESPASKATPHLDVGAHAIARCRAGHEDHGAFAARDAVPTRGDALDL
jgi:hypothetical protein